MKSEEIEKDGRVYTFEEPIEYIVSGNVTQHQTYNPNKPQEGISPIGGRQVTNRAEREFWRGVNFFHAQNNGCIHRVTLSFKNRRFQSKRKGSRS